MSDHAKPTASKATTDASLTTEPVAHAKSADVAESEGARGKGHADKPAAPKKKKGKGKSGPTLAQRIQTAVQRLRVQIIELFGSLRSPDRPTRRMTVGFFISLFIVIYLGILTLQRRMRLQQLHASQIIAARIAAEERQAEAELLGNPEAVGHGHATSMLNLGQFTIELKPRAGAPVKAKGLMNMAEVEIVLECDSQATHDFVEENMVQVRSQLTDIFLSMDREELLSREGKSKLKRKLLERLNSWLSHGKIQNIFFSKLIVA